MQMFYGVGGELEVEDEEENKITICFVVHLKWYNFDMILYGYKLRNKFILIYLDLCSSMVRGVEYLHDTIFINMIDTMTQETFFLPSSFKVWNFFKKISFNCAAKHSKRFQTMIESLDNIDWPWWYQSCLI